MYWLQQTEIDVPPENDWLSESEAVRLGEMRFAKRHADWRLGRWAAKCATAVFLDLLRDRKALAAIEIRLSLSGAPEAFCLNQPAPATISISHRNNAALCAIAPLGTDLGCDLEMIEPHSEAFIADYFTTREQTQIARTSAVDRPRLVSLLWSAKESTLKALRVGLRLDTRSVEVTFLDGFLDEVCVPSGNRLGSQEGTFSTALTGFSNWRPLQVSHADGQIFHGWWQQTGDMLRTLVATPPLTHPICLKLPPIVASSTMGTIR